ncbi:MAG: methylated-DNA--[protein]-cysteine S-methyltransferase [Halofilum sp. (in: g-proteobacteria)]
MSAVRGGAAWTSPCGRVAIEVADDYVVSLDWTQPGPARAPDHALAAEALRQVMAWFDDPGRGFDLPLAPASTRFRARVRTALQAIEPGTTRTYGALARELGTAARAVGGACRSNPISLIVPCHRVVAQGGIGGYAGTWGSGAQIDRKSQLLVLERDRY